MAASTPSNMKTIGYTLDPIYKKVGTLDTLMCKAVWQDKYRWGEESWDEMAIRVCEYVFSQDKSPEGVITRMRAEKMMQDGIWMPAGRILAGAGTPKRVTLLNCFVNLELEDDMASIAEGLGNIMLTMQQGGGIGTDFTPLRPPLALLRRTGSIASGPGPFIDTWDSACTTIRSAGDRRGAMMGTLGCWHPFLPEFIRAKHTKNRWTNFNVSVLVTDAFMAAVQDDEEWYLHHRAEPSFTRPPELTAKDFQDDEIDDGHLQYVYSVHRARDLWDQIIRSTYDYAEPGVIFIDRVNDLNNLQPWEHIQCTNPCGEQPLPPHGCCDLGAINISRLVKAPFTEEAEFDWDLLTLATKVGIRFLDNVIDVTNYPLPEQREEEFAKRRVGLGISGLADAMHMMNLRYGSPKSCQFAEQVMKHIACEAYLASAELAKEKGSAPIIGTAADRSLFMERPFIKQLPEYIQDAIRTNGMRNGVALTIAPTGTTTIAYGNGSSGLEPVFAHSLHRKVRGTGDDWVEYDEVAFGARLFMLCHPGSGLDDLPSYMNVCADVRVHEHIRIQEVCQRWVDASISKTINVPEDIDYETFKDVYQLAYDSGCKGCTTYRPTELRGSILSVGGETKEDPTRDVQASGAQGVGQKDAAVSTALAYKRPETILGITTKIRWTGLASALYLTINYTDEGQPYEVFINSKDQKALEWTMALTVLMSMALRTGIPLLKVAEEFQQVHALEGGWAPDGSGKQKYWPSLIAYLGHKLLGMQVGPKFAQGGTVESAPGTDGTVETVIPKPEPVEIQLWGAGGSGPTSPPPTRGELCPECGQYTLISLSGCLTCQECGHSKCS